MTDRIELEKMTWPEVEAAIKDGMDTVIFACGATEQHGPHLPLNTDTVLGTELAVRAARKLGNALVAPTIRPGNSEHHMGFAGTLTLSFDTFIRVLEDYCTSLARHGFKRICFFSSHGGNTDLMLAHYPAIAKKLADTSLVFMALPTLEEMLKPKKFLQEHGITPNQAGFHAGYDETAEMLVVVPELVHMDKAVPGRVDDAFYANAKWSQLESFVKGIRYQEPTGSLGDPTGANAEMGEILLDMRAEAIAADIRKLPK